MSRTSMGTTSEQNLELRGDDRQYADLHFSAQRQTSRQNQFVADSAATTGGGTISRKRDVRLRAKGNRNALPTLGSSNGNVPGGGASLYHHADWQMVERRIFALHSEAGGAVLVTCCETNAHFPIISNDPKHRTTSCFNQRLESRKKFIVFRTCQCSTQRCSCKCDGCQ